MAMNSDEKLAKRVAKIFGDGSAAAKALRELDRRRNAGEDDLIIALVHNRHGTGTWIVGPRPSPS